MIIEKVGGFQRHDFLPSPPDRLFKAMNATTNDEKEIVERRAQAFFEAFLRMDPDERKVVAAVMIRGCPAEIPMNLHMSMDLLRRETGWPIVRVKDVLTGLRSLGIQCSDREPRSDEHDHHWRDDDKALVFEYAPLKAPPVGAPAADLLRAIVGILGDHYCREHLFMSLEQGDFGTLSSKVQSRHTHDTPVAQASIKAVVAAAKPKKKRKHR